MTGRSLRMLIASAEMYPFAKIGGLADVVGALPKQLASMGHDVRVVIPAYRGLGGEPELTFELTFGNLPQHVVVRRLATQHGVEVLTVGAPGWFDRATPYGYQDEDVLPFVFFGLAVTAYAARSPWRPDVIHANDWHCGLIAQLAREGAYREDLDGVGVVFTIHNIAYQGPLGAATDRLIGLSSWESMLARGIAFADKITTVSGRYLEEVLTPAGGAGMHELLRARRDDAIGILNGVDYTEFSPERDPWLPTRYDGSFIVGKRQNKEALQRCSGLDLEPRRPMFGVVARLVPQKGVGLLCRAVDELVARGGQLVVMGTGERRYRTALRVAAAKHPRSVAFHDTADEGLARLVYAGSDLFLAPSTYEPCGLTPLISLRYGTIPVVRRTGGMADTVVDYAEDPARGLGFTFGARRVDGMLAAADKALAVYHHADEWQRLQHRAMAADFSWRRPAAEYVALYGSAIERRRRSPVPVANHGSHASTRRLPVPVALVHHANQYLITESYPDREGLGALVRGYTAVLRLHEKYQVPAHLHLSGTLIEAAAWSHPDLLQMVRRLRERELVTLVGGAYSDSVLPEFGEEFKRRQLRKMFWLHERHFGCPPEELSIFWVPERVWRTGALASTITDPVLPNGGYRYVLLDDRLLYPTDGQYAGSDRELFDNADRSAPPPADCTRLHRIAGGNGLHVLPISTRLRYWVPPSDKRDWASLARLTDMTVAPGDDAVLVYADDMEKTAGVGPWDSRHLDRFEAFLRWLTAQPNLLPVSLPDWLAQRRRPAAIRDIQPGTYLELARGWRAEEDYSGWSGDPAWAPYRHRFAASEGALLAAERAGASGSLLELAWTHLLASGYETGWRDTTRPDRPPAPWAKALASHARSSRVLADAALWFASSSAESLRAEVLDLDDDGEEEVVLASAHLYAVVAPRHGGRLVYLAARTDDGGALVVGNPSDDWNWQESLNRHMDRPANHPGALSDSGAFDDRYRATVEVRGDGAVCELVNLEMSGPMRGARKRLVLGRDSTALVVEYDVVQADVPTVVSCCLSPDYATLLSEGRSALQRYDGPGWRGMRTGEVSVWLALEEAEESSWVEPEQSEVGHGAVLDFSSARRSFHLMIGTGATNPGTCSTLFDEGRSILASMGAPTGPAEVSTR
jgi:starch synthase